MTTPDPVLSKAMQSIRDAITEAEARHLKDATHASLATTKTDGQPSVRTIYLTAIQDDGIVFFVNSESGKGKQLQKNPKAGLCLFWPEVQTQVTLEGEVSPLPIEDSNRYWALRPRDAKIASWASDQAGETQSQENLRSSRDQVRHDHAFEEVPRPEVWQGLLFQPTRIEFWRTGWQHLRARHLLWLDDAGQWQEADDNP
ncbi:MAG: pyridoxal 5'-phosphate synthase [Salinisphaeraceae bacterium]|nr:pyridoxal 5'-phosphate synthase [Salinisphaeraceae bacterium]